MFPPSRSSFDALEVKPESSSSLRAAVYVREPRILKVSGNDVLGPCSLVVSHSLLGWTSYSCLVVPSSPKTKPRGCFISRNQAMFPISILAVDYDLLAISYSSHTAFLSIVLTLIMTMGALLLVLVQRSFRYLRQFSSIDQFSLLALS
jgi:hypothetical protein